MSEMINVWNIYAICKITPAKPLESEISYENLLGMARKC